MKRQKLLLVLLLAFATLGMAGCTKDATESGIDGNGSDVIVIDEDFVDPGIIRIKLKPEIFENVAINTTRSGFISTGIPKLDEIAQAIGATRMERTFRHGGKYEERRRKAGLHLWYDIHFDETVPVTRAANQFNALNDMVQFVEPSRKVVQVGNPQPYIALGPVVRTEVATRADDTERGSELYFNDPDLAKQWHYNNDGKLGSKFEMGADINLYKAWEIETGKPEVIVAIMDGGVQHTHPDLAANMWVNTAEIAGNGVDDDGNGYIDDIYGYNFVFGRQSGKIDADSHGTHVAGTVAAVNNNGIGVCGVAGGNGNNESGARIMTCEIIYGERDGANSQGIKDAFAYAADNGAVISQNSWGYGSSGSYQPPLDASDKDAIDYFIDNAGDYPGSPMKGGIVIFAAGNENLGGQSFPAAYNRVISVTAMKPNFTKTSYTNYGNWTDIAAPGGERNDGTSSLVYSTTTINTYIGMEGTSMACPHVSGVAALVISKFGVGKDNFTNEDLWKILTESVNDINQYNRETYRNRLGLGYIDAYKALTHPDYQSAPDKVTDLTATWNSNAAELKWSVTADADNGKASKYEVLYSLSDLTGASFSNPPAGAAKVSAEVGSKNVDDEMTLTITGLELNTTYYVAITGLDSDGNRSAATTISGKTLDKPNNAPKRTDKKFEDITIKTIGESKVIDLSGYFTDEDDDALTYSVSVDESFFTQSVSGSQLTLTAVAYGSSPVTVTASDGQATATGQFVASCVKETTVTLYPNPMSKDLYVRSNTTGTAKVEIFNSVGSRAISTTVNVHAGNQSDGYIDSHIDVSKLSGGNYSVVVTLNGKEYKRSVTKL